MIEAMQIIINSVPHGIFELIATQVLGDCRLHEFNSHKIFEIQTRVLLNEFNFTLVSAEIFISYTSTEE